MIHKDNYIYKSNKIHNNKYDYSKVNYKNAKTKVVIGCPKHGDFEQNMDNHSNGQGCRLCKSIKISMEQLSDTNEFILKSNKIHNNKYDYSKVNYKNAKTKVVIGCPEHGDFKQKPNNHLSGYGCEKCSISKRLSDTNEFILKSNKIHNNKYDYSKVDYKNAKTKVIIGCLIHGDFEQKPNNHLNGNGCKKCSIINNRKSIIKRIEKDKLNGNQLYPNYNKYGCNIFDKISKETNIHIQHAMNGGEFYIKELGYWVDGYDTKNNVVYEYDEKHHYEKGELKKRDIIRQKEITNLLNCEFIRINE